MTTDLLNPTLDLVLERTVDIAPELVWAAWTTPEHLKQWFTPRPWTTVHCEIDLRPGGAFHTVMRSPEGQEFPGTSCYLEVVPGRRLVWTSALGAAYRPNPASGAPDGELLFTAFITLEPHGRGTRYTARVLHADPASRERHEAMGFHTGWGRALDQLVEYMTQSTKRQAASS
jgi:uncharacterized protein YndB with AHSA1/START domain